MDVQNSFQLTSEFVQHTGCHIFLTGKAGTGKTTFLKHIRKECSKNMVVVAPTGVAAINAGGVTAHSFFHLPLGTFIPGSFRSGLKTDTAITDRYHLIQNLRLSNDRRTLMRNLELVVVDEVSMLRADMLDAIDTVLRAVRNRQREVFGGVQMLFIGDLYQLPPVAKAEEWELLEGFYNTPFFFDSLAFQQAQPILIELKKVYRQNDEQFISMLNRIRNNEVEFEDMEQLHQLYKPGFRPSPDNHFITLTTHNLKADAINAQELHRLPDREFTCTAIVEGEFNERNYPVEKELHLKAGAQVMFVRNDVEEKKYFNGKIGVLKEINHDGDDEYLRVEFPETKEVIAVRKVSWKNIRYEYNGATNEITENEIGSFTQYPLRLAWAVTIHKSQGLTFSRAVIDAGKAFAAGQVYVALSRCISLDGIVLLSPIPRHAIATDPRIVEFMQQQRSTTALLSVLEKEKEDFFINNTLVLFDLAPLAEKVEAFMVQTGEVNSDAREKSFEALHAIHQSLLEMKTVAEKFREKVKQFSEGGLNEDRMQQLTLRVNTAKEYFEKQLDEKVNQPLTRLNHDMKQQTRVRKLLTELKAFIDFFEAATIRFSLHPEARKERIKQTPAAEMVEATAGDELLVRLKKIRNRLAATDNLPQYRVVNNATLDDLVSFLPLTIEDMALLRGMKNFTLKSYGPVLLAAIVKYCKEKNLASKMDAKRQELEQTAANKKSKAKVKGQTKELSYRMFMEGKTIRQIADERNLTTTTIESHLAHYVLTGQLNVLKFITRQKLERIAAAAKQKGNGLAELKNYLGNDVSYGELKMALAHLYHEADNKG